MSEKNRGAGSVSKEVGEEERGGEEEWRGGATTPQPSMLSLIIDAAALAAVRPTLLLRPLQNARRKRKRIAVLRWHADGGEVRRGLAVGLQKEETQKLAVRVTESSTILENEDCVKNEECVIACCPAPGPVPPPGRPGRGPFFFSRPRTTCHFFSSRPRTDWSVSFGDVAAPS